jgi:hypothetical protein
MILEEPREVAESFTEAVLVGRVEIVRGWTAAGCWNKEEQRRVAE